MDVTLKIIVLLSVVFSSNGVNIREQLAHIAQRRQENAGIGAVNTRRRYNMQGEGSVILGAPSFPSHLPEAEPILPGHTLIRPALGMLKSAVKFPHKDMENGAGVYGNINNLGIKYDGRNERLMYSGFRRTPTDMESSSEVTRLQLHKKPPKFTNVVKRMVKIFPAKPINKRKPFKLKKSKKSSSEETRSHLRNKPPKFTNVVKRMVKIFPAKPINKRKPFHMLKRSKKSSSEETLSHLRKKAPKFTNLVKRMVKIFPAKPINKRKPFHMLKRSKKYDPTQSKLLSSGQYNQNIKRTLTSRLHSSAKTLLFMKNMLHKGSNSKRRQDNIILIKPQADNSEELSSEAENGIDPSSKVTESSKDPAETHKWYWKTKDAFNHIKINSDAPDHEEHLPSDSMDENDLRNWWYYHQADFKPFDKIDD